MNEIICYSCNKRLSNKVISRCQCYKTVKYSSGNIEINIEINNYIYEIYYLFYENRIELTVESLPNLTAINCYNYNPINKSKEELTDFILKQLKLQILL